MPPGCDGVGGVGVGVGIRSGAGGGSCGHGVVDILLAKQLQVLTLLNVVTAVVAPVGTATPSAGCGTGLGTLKLAVLVVVRGDDALGLGVPGLLKGPLTAQLGPGAQVVLEQELAVVLLAHDEELAVVDVAQVLKVFDGEVIPLHEEDAGHKAVGDEDAHAGKVVLAKLTPQALVEAADAVVGVGGALAVGDPVEEVAVVGALLPHAFHLGAAWLEVAKVLLAEAGLLVDFDVGAAEGGGAGLVGGEGGEDALGGLTGAAVGRGEEVDGVVGAEEVAHTASGVVGLGPALLGQFDSVIGDGLMDLAIS